MIRRRFTASLVSGLLLALAFPCGLPHSPLFGFSPLCWIALVPLLAASLGASRPLAFVYGFLHGAVFSTVTLPWIYTVMRQYGPLTVLEAAGVLALLVVFLALYPALFCLGVAHLGKSSVARACLVAPFLWVALELVRTRAPIVGFPWNLLGYPAATHLGLLQLASWTGIYGLSFVVAAYNALLTWFMVSRSRGARLAFWGATPVLILVLGLGWWFVPTETPHRLAHLVYTDFPQAMSYPPNWLELHAADLNQLETLSVAAARRSPGPVVWPEVPAPFSMQDRPFAARAQRMAREAGTDFLVGADDWKLGPRGKWSVSNSAVLLDPSGREVFVYDKIHLVPFGEYVPLRRWLSFAGKLTAEIGDFTPGTQSRVGTLPDGRFAVFICYESIFPAEVRRFVAGGAELLVNISNDGWFGHSAAAAQHLAMARVRAVENRRWLLRDTNNGYTAVVDPYGRYVERVAPGHRGVLDAPFNFRADRTLYSRWGDWWAWVSVAAAAAGFLAKGKARQA